MAARWSWYLYLAFRAGDPGNDWEECWIDSVRALCAGQGLIPTQSDALDGDVSGWRPWKIGEMDKSWLETDFVNLCIWAAASRTNDRVMREWIFVSFWFLKLKCHAKNFVDKDEAWAKKYLVRDISRYVLHTVMFGEMWRRAFAFWWHRTLPCRPHQIIEPSTQLNIYPIACCLALSHKKEICFFDLHECVLEQVPESCVCWAEYLVGFIFFWGGGFLVMFRVSIIYSLFLLYRYSLFFWMNEWITDPEFVYLF